MIDYLHRIKLTFFLNSFRAEDDGRREVFQSAQEHARWATVHSRILYGSAELAACRAPDAARRLPGRLNTRHSASQEENRHDSLSEAVGDERKCGISSRVLKPISSAAVTANTQHHWRTSPFPLWKGWQRGIQVNSTSTHPTHPVATESDKTQPYSALKGTIWGYVMTTVIC